MRDVDELIPLEGLGANDEIRGRWRVMDAKPHNGAEYWQLFLDEARRTQATHLKWLGSGDEAIAYELYRNGKPMQAVIRMQVGGVPMQPFDGILPFYHDEVYERPGDPEPDWGKLEGPIHSPYGVRINVMPKLWQMPPDGTEGMYIVDEDQFIQHYDTFGNASANTISQIAQRLNAQGMSGIDMVHGMKNIGFYCAKGGQYVPMSFDPGSQYMYRYPATIKPGSHWDQARARGTMELVRKGEAKWMDRALWRGIRREVEADAERLYAGKPTAYSQRIERGGVDIPTSVKDMLTQERGSGMSR